jgi:dTDP-glucose 4,6-dehydratase
MSRCQVVASNSVAATTPVFVDCDEIAGIVPLSKSDEPFPVNIGNPNEFTILECAKAVLEVTRSDSQTCTEPLPEDDPKQRRPDITKARTRLGWEPRIDLPTGLRLSLDYFRPTVLAAPTAAPKQSPVVCGDAGDARLT